jgi:ring-1,2-phenylacetyl-CoA epoxidase subunit PaaC
MTKQTAGLTAFIDLIEAIADNKYVMGDRLVEVGIGGPNLEAILSSIAMAQGELGHARLLYNWTFDLREQKGKKPEIEKQTGKALDGVVKAQNWISLMAALYTVNVALDVVLKSVLEARHTEVVARIHKLIREQKEHIMYASNWAQQLLKDEGAIPRKFREALEQIVPEAETWLLTLENTTELVAEGYLLPNASLVKQFKEQLGKVAPQGAVVHGG